MEIYIATSKWCNMCEEQLNYEIIYKIGRRWLVRSPDGSPIDIGLHIVIHVALSSTNVKYGGPIILVVCEAILLMQILKDFNMSINNLV